MCRLRRLEVRVVDARNRADGSRQKVVRFKQPDKFHGPFPRLRYLTGISKGEGLRQGLVKRRSLSRA